MFFISSPCIFSPKFSLTLTFLLLLLVMLIIQSYPLFFFREHSNFVNCVRFSPDGNRFITVSSDKKGIIYDGKTGAKIGELAAEDGHRGSIYAVSWSPDSTQVKLVPCLFYLLSQELFQYKMS